MFDRLRKKLWFGLLRLLHRLRMKLLPPPVQPFFAQCDTCSKSATVTARTMADAIAEVPAEFMKKHAGHSVGIFSEDGSQEDSLNWENVSR